MSGMDKILEIHGTTSLVKSDVRTLIILARGGFGPRLSGRGSMDGCQRDAERERSVPLTLEMSPTKI